MELTSSQPDALRPSLPYIPLPPHPEGRPAKPRKPRGPRAGAPPKRWLSSQSDQGLVDCVVRAPFSLPPSHRGLCFLVSKPASILPDLSRVALNQREINGYIQLPFIFGPTVFSP